MLSDPPRDNEGNVVPHDHPEIEHDDLIIRRVSAQQIVPDVKSPTGRKVSTIVFNPSSEGNGSLSVDLHKSIVAANLDPKAFVTNPRWIGSVYLTAGEFRARSLKVGFDPLVDNIHHGGVWGVFNRSVKAALLKEARWFVEIDNVDLGS